MRTLQTNTNLAQGLPLKTESLKLLGTIITDDLKWDMNTDYKTKKGLCKIRAAQEVKKVPTSSWGFKKNLYNLYQKHIRTIQ